MEYSLFYSVASHKAIGTHFEKQNIYMYTWNTLYHRDFSRVSDPDPHVFALPGSGSGQEGKEMNE